VDSFIRGNALPISATHDTAAVPVYYPCTVLISTLCPLYLYVGVCRFTNKSQSI